MTPSTTGRAKTGILYARQFIAGPEWHDIPRLSIRHIFSKNVGIQVDDLLLVTRASTLGAELVCLGSIIDPSRPEADNRQVLEAVGAASATFEDLERATTPLGGRWLLFARIGGRSRLYPDAAGLKSVYYAKSTRGLWLGSQPGVLATAAGTPLDPTLMSRLNNAEHADSWPGDLTPYPGVKSLLPNHYLDLDHGVATRFWPRRPIEPSDTKSAAEATAEMLHGTIMAALARYGHASVALTAGYESRCLLACAAAQRSRLSFFTVVDATSPWYEYWTPRRLAWQFHLNYRHLWAYRGGNTAVDLLKQNTGQMWRDPNEHRTSAFAKADAPVLILGNASEVCRCEYYEDTPHPDQVTPELLSKTFGWGNDAMAIQAYAEWLASVPSGMNINLLDMLYWEARLGTWCSLGYTAMDGFVEAWPAFNSRRFFELGLGTPVADRQLPCELYLQVCRITTPQALDLPFNHSALTDLRKRLRQYLPWRVRKAAQSVLQRLAGASQRGRALL
jgi:hypothetical protein